MCNVNQAASCDEFKEKKIIIASSKSIFTTDTMLTGLVVL